MRRIGVCRVPEFIARFVLNTYNREQLNAPPPRIHCVYCYGEGTLLKANN